MQWWKPFVEMTWNDPQAKMGNFSWIHVFFNTQTYWEDICDT